MSMKSGPFLYSGYTTKNDNISWTYGMTQHNSSVLPFKVHKLIQASRRKKGSMVLILDGNSEHVAHA